MKRGLIGLLLLASFSLAGTSAGFNIGMFVPPSSYSLAWNVPTSTPIIYYPLHISSNASISVTVTGAAMDVHTGFSNIHDFIVTLNAGLNTLNLSAIDTFGNVQTLQGAINVIAQQSTVSVGGSTQSIGVEFPVGSLDQFATATANIVTQSYSIPAGASLNGLVVDIKLISSTQNVILNSVFSVPVILQLPYFGTATRGVVVGYLETRVSPSVWRYDGVHVVSVNTTTHKVWAAVDHFTIFAVFAFSDLSAPVISQVQANTQNISDGSFISAQPVFTMILSDSQPSDSGVVSYNVSLSKVGGGFFASTSNAIAVTSQVNFNWDLSSSPLTEGDYRLVISVEDASGWVATKTISLVYQSVAQISSFLGGPNPVNFKQSAYGAHFTYNLSKPMATTIRIFDVAGRRVRQIASPAIVGQVNNYDVPWNGRTDQGDMVPAGLYIVYITADEAGASSAKRFMMLVTK
jgi:hypothetical protein